MCTSRLNERLVGQLECYMDDMVECFEEFLKKSMLVISVAVGTLVLTVMYIVKRIIERAASRVTVGTTGGTACKCCQVCLKDLTTNVETICTNTKSLVNVFLSSAKYTRTVSSQVIPTSCSSCDSNSPKSSKACDTSKNTQVSLDLKNSRNNLAFTTKQPCISKNHLSTSRHSSQVIEKRNSCCSVCCGDESCDKS